MAIMSLVSVILLGLTVNLISPGASFPAENRSTLTRSFGILTNSLGPVDGKIYSFNSTPRTWDEAKAYCENTGRKLAKVEKKEHKDFLNANYRKFLGHFWTAGRDSLTITQFVWDDATTPTALVADAVNLEYHQGKRTCLLYGSSVAPGFEGILCTLKYGSLCEEPAA